MNMQTASIENHNDVTKVDNSVMPAPGIPESGNQCSPNPDEKTFETKAELGWDAIPIEQAELEEDVERRTGGFTPRRPNEGLPNLHGLFRKLRRFQRMPPVDDVICELIAQGVSEVDTRKIVAEICSIFQESKRLCGGNRKCACVLTGLEYLSRRGYRLLSRRDISKLIGQKEIFRCLESLMNQGLMFRADGASAWGYQITQPIRTDSSPPNKGGKDPIAVLRLEDEALSANSQESLKPLLIDAVKAVAIDAVRRREIAIEKEISRIEKLRKKDLERANEIDERLRSYKSAIGELEHEISDVRWAFRNPFAPISPYESEYRPQVIAPEDDIE